MGRRGLALAGATAIVVAGFAVTAGFMDRYAVWQAESFGDRRLAAPTPSECQIARAVLKDHRDHDRAALLRSVGAAEARLELRAFAWRSTGARIPREGVDWRKCRGLGAYARGLGMAHLGSGGSGPLLYISRPIFRGDPGEALVYDTFSPPQSLQGASLDGGARFRRAWQVALRRQQGGWVVVRRAPIDPR